MSTPPPYGTPGQDPYGQQPGYGYGTPPPGYGPGPGYPPAPGGFGGPPPGGAPIPNYLWQSIVTTVLCCLPAGIVALVYSTRVQPKQQMGDIQGALEASKKAKTWCIVSVSAAGAILLLYVVIWVIILGAIASSD
ncbi:CD225/dispanin family protein [Frankia sp. CNm7]|uniref:CD225/dispanin family protein n=1 Tax=Frankia nepalensis TaxID=1836974 RepID=A0A937UVW2_9ACTN|nr:CD225/dispanin family protein [Frankia nepalensis]MBL7500717.1 CD225/dispanin family protein [Frankia nepalensis]MBL7516239.1 CD225/dispanin family protein [Frankia nepalensis]MBL7519591.1 CD225/dispanin family protein [Frankia nepalensis]MBL7632731.1 CD225/dispanin family protein [Frankia nepalensis]